MERQVKSVNFNWHQNNDGNEADEDYMSYTVGYGDVTSIKYHEPQGEGDAHYCDIKTEDGKEVRQFNINSIEFMSEAE